MARVERVLFGDGNPGLLERMKALELGIKYLQEQGDRAANRQANNSLKLWSIISLVVANLVLNHWSQILRALQ